MTDLAHPDRLAKVARMRAEGQDPYPARGVAATPAGDLAAGAGTPEEPGPLLGETVTVAGRLLGQRDFGKLIFAPVRDRSGRLQVGLQKARLADWWPNRKLLDPGDLVAFTGELGHTQKGEPTVWASEVHLQAKAVAPPPEKWHGLADKELRYRRRYVDLWSSEGVSDVFVLRSRVLSITRRFLEDQGYLEVETPVLQPLFGGAAAKPFVTHHNALGMDLYLRIAPELYLKRLIVGGLERVFEFARNFRNEGLSPKHNPEFTMLELYEAQADFHRIMELVEQLFERLATELHGTTEVTFRGETYDFAAPFQRVRYADAFAEHNDGLDLFDDAGVRARAKALGLDLPPDTPLHKVAGEVFDATAEPHLTGPVFLSHYPLEISPLAKKDPEDGRFTERFEVFVAGMELGNAFTELNDPADQEERFVEQVEAKDPELPGEVDVDYVQALEYGMPPTGGLGVGIDRLCMVLADQESIRDVLLFPAMKPLQSGDDPAEPEEAPDAAPASPPERAEAP